MQLGYALGRQFWGPRPGRGGTGTAGRHLRANPALFRVAAYVHPDNLRSAGFLERVGFTVEGRVALAITFPNVAAEPQDAMLYGMALR